MSLPAAVAHAVVPDAAITPCAETGRLAVCRRGYLGRIAGRATLPWGEGFVGTHLFTGAPWSSTAPLLLAEDALPAGLLEPGEDAADADAADADAADADAADAEASSPGRSNVTRALATLQEARPATGRLLSAREIMDRSLALTDAAERAEHRVTGHETPHADTARLDWVITTLLETGAPLLIDGAPRSLAQETAAQLPEHATDHEWTTTLTATARRLIDAARTARP